MVTITRKILNRGFAFATARVKKDKKRDQSKKEEASEKDVFNAYKK